MYVDLDTGTILGGPIAFIPLDVPFDCEGMTDQDVIDRAIEVGIILTPVI